MSDTLQLSKDQLLPVEAKSSLQRRCLSKSIWSKEILAWSMFDFADMGSYTVLLTTVFNCYFINEIAGGGGGLPISTATLLWTLTMAVSNLLVVLTAPILGEIADHSGKKKRFLIVSSVCFMLTTVMLAFVQPGQILAAMSLAILCNFLAWSGLNLVAAFLPEIATKETMGRVSGISGALGYAGTLVMLGSSLAYVSFAEHQGQAARQFVPLVIYMTTLFYLLSVLPSFLWLKERAPGGAPRKLNYISLALSRVSRSLADARQFKDLYNFLLALLTYSCGTSTVLLLAAVYAQQVMSFTHSEVIVMMLAVSLAAGIGAVLFGHLQDKIGSIRTLQIELLLWILGALAASVAHTVTLFWVVAIGIGLAAGGIRITGRAIVGQFSPEGRSAEFFGLWGLGINLSYAIGPVIYGLISYMAASNQRLAILSTVCFFVAGLALLSRVNEQRGRLAAKANQ